MMSKNNASMNCVITNFFEACSKYCNSVGLDKHNISAVFQTFYIRY